jgi:hypothetical protein
VDDGLVILCSMYCSIVQVQLLWRNNNRVTFPYSEEAIVQEEEQQKHPPTPIAIITAMATFSFVSFFFSSFSCLTPLLCPSPKMRRRMRESIISLWLAHELCLLP